MPKRIQLKRTKGWRMPPNTVKVDRSTKWGNPFVIGETYSVFEDDGFSDTGETMKIETAEDAVFAYRNWMECGAWAEGLDPEELRGKDLACWCKPGAPCHADVLLELANAPTEGDG